MSPFNPHYGLTDEYRAEVLLTASWTSVAYAANLWQVHTSTIYKWRKRMGIKR